MEIIKMPIGDIKPYPNNPRRNDDAVAAVVESIKSFGFKNPIIVDKDNVIIAGHTRFRATQALDMAEVPCIKADDLTAEQAQALRLVDNKTSELSGWDFDRLEQELADLGDVFDMTTLGFLPMNNINFDAFFEEAEEKKKEPKRIQCPHCGEWFEA